MIAASQVPITNLCSYVSSGSWRARSGKWFYGGRDECILILEPYRMHKWCVWNKTSILASLFEDLWQLLQSLPSCRKEHRPQASNSWIRTPLCHLPVVWPWDSYLVRSLYLLSLFVYFLRYRNISKDRMRSCCRHCGEHWKQLFPPSASASLCLVHRTQTSTAARSSPTPRLQSHSQYACQGPSDDQTTFWMLAPCPETNSSCPAPSPHSEIKQPRYLWGSAARASVPFWRWNTA